jgi:hypothetical protein
LERNRSTAEVRSPFVYQSAKGRYFVARTGVFPVAAGEQALILFEVPKSSDRRAFLVVVTLTSSRGRRAFFYYDVSTDAHLTVATRVANIHRGEPDDPVVRVSYGASPSISLKNGVDAFERLLQGQVTLNTEQAGRFIFEPGHTFGVHLPSVDAPDELDVAWGWWEEEVGRSRRR